jgi:hypothetical protein
MGYSPTIDESCSPYGRPLALGRFVLVYDVGGDPARHLEAKLRDVGVCTRARRAAGGEVPT